MSDFSPVPIHQLSFWERNEYFEAIDFLIVGAGIVGCSAAYHLRKKYPKAKIIVVERGYLPAGASTKNAGFACFGSASELLYDLENQAHDLVWETVQARYEGLIYLREIIGDKAMDFQQLGGWDLITQSQPGLSQKIRDILPLLNTNFHKFIPENQLIKEDKSAVERFGFKQTETTFYNPLEGQIHSAKMMKHYHRLLVSSEVPVLYGVEVSQLSKNHRSVHTNIGVIEAHCTVLALNAFTKQLLPEEDIQPARGQVLVTAPVPGLKLRGTFHHDFGFYYFRNYENRILLGGARNTDIEGETTTEFNTTENIQTRLKQILTDLILPEQKVSIDYRWAGIMGMGKSKKPILKKYGPHLIIAGRLGGIGVAIGTQVGKKLATLV